MMMMMSEVEEGNIPQQGLMITTTEAMKEFLVNAAASKDNTSLPQQLRQSAISLSSMDTIPYQSFRTIWSASHPSSSPPLLPLFIGSGFVFTSPKPRHKSEELKSRLRKLEEMAERKAYGELVKDITPRKQHETEPFSSYKHQLGFGLHVVVIMFTGYLVGYAAFRALFGQSAALSAAGGVLGLVGGMLVETLLFIIRSSSQDLRASSSTTNLKKNQ